jgi:hypothetical protein
MILIIQWMNTSAERNMMAEGRISVLKPLYRLEFLNRGAAARYRVLASITPGREKFSWKLSF